MEETRMRKMAIIVDLDNTLVDTAMRKCSLLKEFLPGQDVSEDKVREDFDLVRVLGPKDTEASKSFVARLDSDDGIRNHPAPLYQGVNDVLASITKLGVDVVVMTGRAESLRAVTVEELTRLKSQQFISALNMLEPNAGSIASYKERRLGELIQRYDVIAVIGDHQDDLSAAAAHHLPFIQLSKALRSPQHNDAVFAGGGICRTWDDIRLTVETILEGRKKLEQLRNDFTDSYARWLADLDGKARITAMISGVLAALAGKLVVDLKQPLLTRDYALIASLSLAVVSLLYCIRSMTSRRTSGSAAGSPISATMKQWLAILVGAPKRWQSRQDDPVDTYLRVLKKRTEEQARAHYEFFFHEFQTYDPEALANLRLLQLRSVNYSKAYAETVASKLLMLSIVLFLVWFICAFVVPILPHTGSTP